MKIPLLGGTEIRRLGDTKDMLSTRDREIIRTEIQDKIDILRPLTEMGIDWRPSFEKAVQEWQRKANGTQSVSPERSEYQGWALAHQFLLDDTAGLLA